MDRLQGVVYKGRFNGCRRILSDCGGMNLLKNIIGNRLSCIKSEQFLFVNEHFRRLCCY
jgi:hypothetical protein